MAAPRKSRFADFTAHVETINCLRFGPHNGRVYATGADDKLVKLWVVGQPTRGATLEGHSSAVECVEFDPPEDHIAAGSSSGTVKVWDVGKQKVSRTFLGHKANCRALAYHPFGAVLASGSIDTQVRIWDLRSKTCTQTLRDQRSAITVVKFSPDGQHLLTGADDGRILMYKLSEGRVVKEFAGHTQAVTSLAFHPRELVMASGSADRTVRFWDMDALHLEKVTAPEATGVRCVAFHPEEDVLLSQSHDSLKVFAWDTEGDSCLDIEMIPPPKAADIAVNEHNQCLVFHFNKCSVGGYCIDLAHMRPFCGETEEAPVRRAAPPPRDPREDAARAEPVEEKKPMLPRLPKKVAREVSKSGRHATVAVGVGPSLRGGPEDPASDEGDVPEDMADAVPYIPANGFGPVPRTPVSPSGPGGGLGTPLANFVPPPPRYPGSLASAMPPSPGVSRFPTGRPPPAPPPIERPIGLDVRSFLPASIREAPPAARAAEAPPPFAPSPVPPGGGGVRLPEFRAQDAPRSAGDDERTLAAIAGEAPVVLEVLSNRLTNIRRVRSYFSNGDVLGAIAVVSSTRDPAVTADTLRVFNLRPKIYSLDAFVQLLPPIDECLRSPHEDHNMVVFATLRVVLRSFGPLIRDLVRPEAERGEVDISRAERRSKCEYCFNSLLAMLPLMANIARKRGAASAEAKEVVELVESLRP